MNVLDPVVLARAAQRRVLCALAELAGSGLLSEWHEKALDVAYRSAMAAFEDAGRVPVMPDLLEQSGPSAASSDGRAAPIPSSLRGGVSSRDVRFGVVG
ncbi:MAG TPA: hypothetical protein VIU11_01970 [Nakamurella sp.]